HDRLAARGGTAGGLAAGGLTAVVTLAFFHLVAQAGKKALFLATALAGRAARATRSTGTVRAAATTGAAGRGSVAVSACKPRGGHQQESGIHLLSSVRGFIRLGAGPGAEGRW